jgi:type I restriction-modification system DNA methylase subunit
MERKETGAYYTPEDVVEYIVNNTVGRKLKELKEELALQRNELLDKLSYEPVESYKKAFRNQIDEITMDFINNKILSLSIIDSAMGSGHFLVNAAYRVANEIVEIICENSWENNDIIADITYWKRKVVENCIYGIDINGLSVALARLSLWLISASNDKAYPLLTTI